jgi:glycerol kinase
MAYVLGIDQGTSQTTALILDDDGQVVAQRSVRLPVRFPQPGWVEQDPWDILRTVREAAQPLAEAFPVAALGFDNQGETFLLWDRRTGQPLTPAIVWQDQRGQAVCQALAPRVEAAWLRQKTGLLLDSYFSAPKLRHVLDQAPELRAAAQAGEVCFGTTESWVLWQLSGGRLHVTDASTASRTLLFNLNDLAWDPELLALFDVPAAMLPVVQPSAGYIGDVGLGTGPQLPVHALVVDQQAALFGQACLAAGEVKCTFGTGSFLLMNTGPAPQLSRHGLLSTVAWHWPGQKAYALDGGIFVTGAAVQWLAETLGLLPDAAASAEAALQAADDTVVCVPALAGLAAPHWRPQARGAFFGLSRATAPADLARAVLRGIACRVVEVVDAMQQDAGQLPATLKVDGGPTGNPFLMQCLADLLDKEVRVAAAREATAIGAASLAGHSALGWSLPEIAARWQAEAVYAPRMPAGERQAHWERWQRAVQAVRHYHGAV